MTTVPFIAISVPVRTSEIGISLVVVESGYQQAVRVAGGFPLFLSTLLDAETVDRLFNLAQGLVLSGGEDVSPEVYGESMNGSRQVSAERDELEIMLLRRAIEARVPVLGICRGAQLMNVALGGTLYQDLATDWGQTIYHDSYREHDQPIHDVTTVHGRRMGDVFTESSFAQNSAHHQGVRVLAPELEAVAWASDGLIEGVELRDRHAAWTVGIQWHPERIIEDPTGTNRRLLHRFGEEVRRTPRRVG